MLRHKVSWIQLPEECKHVFFPNVTTWLQLGAKFVQGVRSLCLLWTFSFLLIFQETMKTFIYQEYIYIYSW